MATEHKLQPYLRHLVLLLAVGLLVCVSSTEATHAPNATLDRNLGSQTTPTRSSGEEIRHRLEERAFMSGLIAAGEAFLPKVFISAKAKKIDNLFKSYDFTKVESSPFMSSEFHQLSRAVLRMFKNPDVGIRVLYAKFAGMYSALRLATFIQEAKSANEIALKFERLQIKSWKGKTSEEVFLLLDLNQPKFEWNNPLLTSFKNFVSKYGKRAEKDPYYALLAMLVKYHGGERGVAVLVAAAAPAVTVGKHLKLQSEVAGMVLSALKAQWTDSKLTPAQVLTRLFPARERGNCLMSPSVRIWIDYVGVHWQSALLDQIKIRNGNFQGVVDDILAASRSDNIMRDIAVQMKKELLIQWQKEGVTDEQALAYLRIDTIPGDELLIESHRLETWIQYMCLCHEKTSAVRLFSALSKLLSVDQLARLLFLERESMEVRFYLNKVEGLLIYELGKQDLSAETVFKLVIRNSNGDNIKNAVLF